MSVSQNNKGRLVFAIFLGILMTSGCSGHSVKYGTNSEGEGLGTEEEMNGAMAGGSNGVTYNADGTPVYGGTVDGASPYTQSGEELSKNRMEMGAGMAAIDGPGSGSDYGHQYNGVDGTGSNYGDVSGFGNGSANSTQPDPEAWANAYLREKRSSQEFYGDPSQAGSSGHTGVGETAQNGHDSGVGETARYGHDYAGVSGSGPNHGAVDGFSQGSSAQADTSPDAWAQAYVQENGGPSPEYVNPDTGIAYANGQADTRSMGMRDARGEIREIRNASSGGAGRVQDIYFAFDSWSISTVGAKYLEEDAQWLHANPEKALTIEGHCDQRGTQDYNLILGKKRAEAAREYLVNLGVQSHRIKIVSYGKERPFCRNNNENCHQENRRNHMVVRVNQS